MSDFSNDIVDIVTTHSNPINVLHVVPSLTINAGMLSVIENYRHHINSSLVHFDYLYFYDEPCDMKDVIEEECRAFYLPFQKSRKPFRSIEQFFAEHNGEYEILHCHPPFTPQLFARAAKRHGVKCVIAHSHSTKFGVKKLSVARNWLFSKLLGFYATDYIACSEGARVLLGAHGKDAFILHNAIDCDKFSFDSDGRKAFRIEHGLADSTLLLGSVGRLSPEKNQVFMIEVLDELLRQSVDCRLALAGIGRCEDALIAKSRELGIDDKVMLLGSRSDTPVLYSAFDAFLLPSLFEGMPVSAIEAQACGLPCFISSNVTQEVGIGNAEFLPIDKGAFVWADAIVEKCHVDSIREMPINELKEFGFDITIEANKLTKYYLNCLRIDDIRMEHSSKKRSKKCF